MSTQSLTMPLGGAGVLEPADVDEREARSAGQGERADAGGGCPLHDLLRWDASRSVASRLGVFAFGLVAYAVFFGTILYAIGFVNNLLVPKSISSGTGGALVLSLAVNGSILFAFVVQHTIMARPWFKRWVTQFISPAIERSVFVLLASVILLALFAFWQPLPQVIWEVDNPIASWALIGLSLFGFGIVFYSTFLINHFDLFGLRQVVTNLQGKRYEPVTFQLSSLYKIVRHPLMLGFLIAFWATPLMTAGHLFFAVMTTAYIIVGVTIEERDLVRAFGEDYLEYRRNVRGLIPLPKRIGGEA